MSGVEEVLDIKFRLLDGSDIGPRKYPAATTISTLKERILSQWPKENNKNGPKTIGDLKLINAGKVLENHKTLGECKNPFVDSSEETITMHVVVRPPSVDKSHGKKSLKQPVEQTCACVIL